MSYAVNPTKYEGLAVSNPPGTIRAARAPTSADLNFPFNTIWVDTANDDVYIYTQSVAGVANWAVAATETNAAALQFADVTITAAQVKAIRAAPITLVAAPAAGKVLMLVGAILKLNYGSEVFAESDDNLAIRYTDGSGVIVSQPIQTTAFLTPTADTITGAIPVVDPIVVATGAEAQALVIHNTGDGEITGNASNDSTVTVRIYYTTQTL